MFDKKTTTTDDDRASYDVTIANKMTRPVEATKTSSITFKEFLEIATPKLLSRDHQEQMKKVFQLIDEEDTGKISFEALKNIASELGECYTDEELKVCICHNI